ncbi:glycyl-radical enzyme activating protein [Chloroflexota bacterium]
MEQKAVVYNIQRYSIHDGPGIRTTVFFKGCPLRCFWCQNPESQRMETEVFLNKDNCTLCGRCVDACPTAASTLSDISSVIDRSKCTGCGKCAEACSKGARTLVGKYLTLAEIMEEVLRDKKFYDNSGGGVTLGGGEPTAQPEMALSILRGCQGAGLHTALDTCGYASWPVMEKLLEYTDLVLYDVKCMDAVKHNSATGKPNELILENAKKIARYKPMRVRVPLVSGFNDSPEKIKAIAHFVRTKLGPVDIDLLPYNKLGESKYERLDRPPVSSGETEEKTIQELEEIVRISR